MHAFFLTNLPARVVRKGRPIYLLQISHGIRDERGLLNMMTTPCRKRNDEGFERHQEEDIHGFLLSGVTAATGGKRDRQTKSTTEGERDRRKIQRAAQSAALWRWSVGKNGVVLHRNCSIYRVPGICCLLDAWYMFVHECST